ncbi:uncharacterized protein [Physcomitrium patens]|uniref:Uncharacterized protein n=1 Tax=Physcomitrium patens TaxID=3218 RepID=A0A2K1JQU1_PHYPA|nr:uncharacterized protein LOC112289560 [Physcomitrium patens]PNR43904.1 hypothetical protein PHYPA_016287 [Physcomitrium patens]|eukprot:XP_024390592.1 uncharacterized protein LOC112289560 [Physcomitrella patens]
MAAPSQFQRWQQNLESGMCKYHCIVSKIEFLGSHHHFEAVSEQPAASVEKEVERKCWRGLTKLITVYGNIFLTSGKKQTKFVCISTSNVVTPEQDGRSFNVKEANKVSL